VAVEKEKLIPGIGPKSNGMLRLILIVGGAGGGVRLAVLARMPDPEDEDGGSL
jgi:hypothetical protein